MTEEERTKELNRERRKAVREARKNERALVLEGKGTRDWTPDEQREWIRTGRCVGYDGHHMKSVKDYPEYAGDAKNIQFLNEKEHYQAHGGDYKNATNGYYNPSTGRMNSFGDSPPRNAPAKALSEPLSERSKKINETKRLEADRQKREADKRAAEIRARREKKEAEAKTNSKTLERERSAGKSTSSEAKTSSKTLERERKSSESTSRSTSHDVKKKHSEKH